MRGGGEQTRARQATSGAPSSCCKQPSKIKWRTQKALFKRVRHTCDLSLPASRRAWCDICPDAAGGDLLGRESRFAHIASTTTRTRHGARRGRQMVDRGDLDGAWQSLHAALPVPAPDLGTAATPTQLGAMVEHAERVFSASRLAVWLPAVAHLSRALAQSPTYAGAARGARAPAIEAKRNACAVLCSLVHPTQRHDSRIGGYSGQRPGHRTYRGGSGSADVERGADTDGARQRR